MRSTYAVSSASRWAAQCQRFQIQTTFQDTHELAIASRNDALTYIHLLEKNVFSSDIIIYCRFLYLLADGSLQQLRQGGAGSKLTRDEVMRILAELKSESGILPV